MNAQTLRSESREAEQALGESEQRYKRLLGAITDYIYTVTVEGGRAVATSHGPGCAAVTGYSSSEFAADPYLWYQVIHEEDRDAVVAQADRILAGEIPLPLEHRLRHKEGGVRWVRNTTIPHRDPNGQLVSYDGLITDITDRKLASLKLEDAVALLARRDRILNKMVQRLRASHRDLKKTQLQLIQAAKLESVGTLAAGVAHEVKNPLQTILLGLHYLTRKLAGEPDDVLLTLADMRDAVRRANAIIRELLLLSAETDFRPEPGDLTAVIERSLLLMRNDLIAGKVDLVCDLATGLPPVPMDAVKLEQVFINFLLNARQAMPQGGRLRVVTREVRLDNGPSTRPPLLRRFKSGQRLVIVEIEDTGCGIAEAHLPRLFDPFFTTKPVGVGTGLGLSVARRIVDLHEGAVEIGNIPTGGARVTMVLKV